MTSLSRRLLEMQAPKLIFAIEHGKALSNVESTKNQCPSRQMGGRQLLMSFEQAGIRPMRSKKVAPAQCARKYLLIAFALFRAACSLLRRS
jgi:hypothetical protein